MSSIPTDPSQVSLLGMAVPFGMIIGYPLSLLLLNTYPALFSHCVRPNVSVKKVFQDNLELHLRPRLTNAANIELHFLLVSLQQVQLRHVADTCILASTSKTYNSTAAYRALSPSGITKPNASFIRKSWGTKQSEDLCMVVL
jgi:hypothetical protein